MFPLPHKTIHLSSLNSLSGPFWEQGPHPPTPRDPTVTPAPSLPLGALRAPLPRLGGVMRAQACSPPSFSLCSPSSLTPYPAFRLASLKGEGG